MQQHPCGSGSVQSPFRGQLEATNGLQDGLDRQPQSNGLSHQNSPHYPGLSAQQVHVPASVDRAQGKGRRFRAQAKGGLACANGHSCSSSQQQQMQQMQQMQQQQMQQQQQQQQIWQQQQQQQQQQQP